MSRVNPAQRPQRGLRRPWRRRDPRPVPPTLAAMLTALPSLPRPVLSRMAVAIIDQLDQIDGDSDLEATHNEDWPDGAPDYDYGPGCPVSDPGGGNVTDEPHDGHTEDGT